MNFHWKRFSGPAACTAIVQFETSGRGIAVFVQRDQCLCQ